MEEPTKKPTGLIFDRVMLEHKCDWDSDHIERPARLERIINRLEATKLLDECLMLPKTKADPDVVIRSVHSPEYIKKIAESERLDMDGRETLCASYEEIYLAEKSYDLALLSAGCAMEAMDAVLDGRCSNAFAAIRPPGHHAYHDQGCGFCLFNNVAICAKRAVTKWGLERVLIVDWDVHAGQGTQYCIADEERIKLLSVHRYEHGHFWPNLPESGVEHEYHNTINIPLHEIGFGDSDYMTIMHHMILPLISDWKPQLILVSCGYDAAFGDPEGQMRITPAGYAHMTSALKATHIPLCVVLEGGYFLESVEADAEWTVRALLGHTLPRLQLDPCRPSLVDTMHAVIQQLAKEFDAFKQFLLFESTLRTEKGLPPRTLSDESYTGKRSVSFPYKTRGLYVYPQRTPEVIAELKQQLANIIASQKPAHNGAPVALKHIDVSATADGVERLLTELLNGSVSLLTVDEHASTTVANLLASKQCQRLELDFRPVGETFHVNLSRHPDVLRFAMSLGGNPFHFALHNILLPIAKSGTTYPLVVVNCERAETDKWLNYLLSAMTSASIPVIVQYTTATHGEEEKGDAKVESTAVLLSLVERYAGLKSVFM
uniref:Histone deacetylase domain-containing protein n=1 Tax=Plectus sambesii TaxID=2011161 RepID=A0A914X4G6_9BILA